MDRLPIRTSLNAVIMTWKEYTISTQLDGRYCLRHCLMPLKKSKKRLNEEERKRTRSRKERGMDIKSCRNPILLTSALRSLARKLWPNLDEKEQLRRRKSLSDNSLSGWKWRQLKYPELVLSLHNSAARRSGYSCGIFYDSDIGQI